MFRLSRSVIIRFAPFTFRHLPDDGWYGQPKNVVVNNKMLTSYTCKIVFGPIINILFIYLLQRIICSVNIGLNERDSSPSIQQQFPFTSASRPTLKLPDLLSNGYRRLCQSVYNGRGLKPITHTKPVPKFKNAWSYSQYPCAFTSC